MRIRPSGQIQIRISIFWIRIHSWIFWKVRIDPAQVRSYRFKIFLIFIDNNFKTIMLSQLCWIFILKKGLNFFRSNPDPGFFSVVESGFFSTVESGSRIFLDGRIWIRNPHNTQVTRQLNLVFGNSYYMSKKYWPILYIKLLHIMGHYFLVTQYIR